MKTPFTVGQFFSVFEKYNVTLFPAQIILFIIATLIVIMISSEYHLKNKVISLAIAMLWLWIGVIYHLSFFSDITNAAFGFTALFIIQGFLFLWVGVFTDNLEFEPGHSIQTYVGYFFILYGMIIYPLINYLTGHDLAHTISIGLPCPTNIFTFGILLLSSRKVSMYLLIIPAIWALIGISAVINLKVYQDSVMIIAAVITYSLLMRKSVPERAEN